MRRENRLDLFVHLVWGTHGRRPLITKAIEDDVFRSVIAKCAELKCYPHAVGGTEDHLHLLARLHPPVPISRLVAQCKGVSSHLVNRHLLRAGRFQWQQGYGAFTIAANDLPAVERYVLDQKQHHARQALHSELELPTEQETQPASDQPPEGRSFVHF
jgi:putative transposase